MPTPQPEAFSRILIDKALKAGGWNLLDLNQSPVWAMGERQPASRRRLDDLFQSLLDKAFKGELCLRDERVNRFKGTHYR